MTLPIWHTRRTLLGAIAACVGATALAGCETASTSAAPPPNAPHASTNDYRLGPADQLRITVFNEAGLTGLFVIGSQGTVAFPLVGDVQAAGLTVAEFSASLRT